MLWAQGVPTNTLHEQGYVSIGCEPCTRPVLPNQHEREGRWWWEVRYILQFAICYTTLKHDSEMSQSPASFGHVYLASASRL